MLAGPDLTSAEPVPMINPVPRAPTSTVSASMPTTKNTIWCFHPPPIAIMVICRACSPRCRLWPTSLGSVRLSLPMPASAPCTAVVKGAFWASSEGECFSELDESPRLFFPMPNTMVAGSLVACGAWCCLTGCLDGASAEGGGAEPTADELQATAAYYILYLPWPRRGDGHVTRGPGDQSVVKGAAPQWCSAARERCRWGRPRGARCNPR